MNIGCKKVGYKRKLFLILIISFAFIVTPVFGAETNVLLGKDYFQTTRQAIQEAKESIYVAMYLINVEPTPTDNPASILWVALTGPAPLYMTTTNSPLTQQARNRQRNYWSISLR